LQAVFAADAHLGLSALTAFLSTDLYENVLAYLGKFFNHFERFIFFPALK
jgi:hypothetical protein